MALRIGRAVTGVYNKVMNFGSIDPRDSRAGLSGAGDTDRAVWSRFFDEKANALDLAKLDAEYARLWHWSSPAIEESDEAARVRGRGYEADPEVRRAVEVRTMGLAKEHYAKLGFEHTDTASTHPYDLLCTKSGTRPGSPPRSRAVRSGRARATCMPLGGRVPSRISIASASCVF